MRQLDENTIKKLSGKYIVQCLLLTTLLALVGIAVMFIMNIGLVAPLAVSYIYNIIVSMLYIAIWRVVMKYSRDSALQLYLGGTGVRLITAMFVVLAYSIAVEDKPERLTFAAVFCIFYMVMLIYDTMFFVKIEREN